MWADATMDAAWIEWNGQLFYSEYRRSVFEPNSAVTQLISGVWRQFPESAHFILRSRIYVNYELSELCRGMMIVCAKRHSRLPCVPASIQNQLKLGERESVHVVSSFGSECSPKIPASQGHGLALQHRSIEAWLLDSEHRVVGWGVNTAGRNRTKHAELNLLHDWWRRKRSPLPDGGRLVCTLEPCPMCAGAIVQCVKGGSDFRVEFLKRETGSSVRRSVLRNSPMILQCKLLDHPFFSQED